MIEKMAAVAEPSYRSLNPETRIGRQEYSTLEPVARATDGSIRYHAPLYPVTATAIDGSQAPIPYNAPNEVLAEKEALGFRGQLHAGRDTSKGPLGGRL